MGKGKYLDIKVIKKHERELRNSTTDPPVFSVATPELYA